MAHERLHLFTEEEQASYRRMGEQRHPELLNVAEAKLLTDWFFYNERAEKPVVELKKLSVGGNAAISLGLVAASIVARDPFYAIAGAMWSIGVRDDVRDHLDSKREVETAKAQADFIDGCLDNLQTFKYSEKVKQLLQLDVNDLRQDPGS